MDYSETALPVRHASWEAFQRGISGRLILLTTKADADYDTVDYAPDDFFLIGQESAGVPIGVHEQADLRVRIPLSPQARSLNMAVTSGIILAEAKRQARQEARASL